MPMLMMRPVLALAVFFTVLPACGGRLIDGGQADGTGNQDTQTGQGSPAPPPSASGSESSPPAPSSPQPSSDMPATVPPTESELQGARTQCEGWVPDRDLRTDARSFATGLWMPCATREKLLTLRANGTLAFATQEGTWTTDPQFQMTTNDGAVLGAGVIYTGKNGGMGLYEKKVNNLQVFARVR
jgi:hypothetical protein